MPTVVKSFTFDTNSETMIDVSPSPTVHFAWQAGDSPSGGGGCVHFTTTSAGLQEGRGQTSGQTWESWGVPHGAVVLSVQVTKWYSKIAASAQLTNNQVLQLFITDSNGSPVYAGPALAGPLNIGTANTGWIDEGAGPAANVLGPAQASNTHVAFGIDILVDVAAGGGENVDVRFDSIELAITYASSPIVSGLTLVQQAHNVLRYLVEYDGTTAIAPITTTGAASPDIRTDALAGPLHQYARAVPDGLGILAPGPLTQAQARAIWMSDNPALVFVGPNGPRVTLTMLPRLNTLAGWAVDVNVDGGGNPVIQVSASAPGKAYLEIRADNGPAWTGTT